MVVEPEQIGIERIRIVHLAESEDERPLMIWFRPDLAKRLEMVARRKGLGVEELILRILTEWDERQDWAFG
jgi:hypothetical protein